ncbi:MAG: hypothetical protein ABSC94_33805 [Polyangiaceae bacterium]|jgi:hypothetical protein
MALAIPATPIRIVEGLPSSPGTSIVPEVQWQANAAAYLGNFCDAVNDAAIKGDAAITGGPRFPPAVRVSFWRAPAPALNPAWVHFLERLPSLGVGTAHAESVRSFWTKLTRAIPSLPFPAAAPTADGEIQLSWDKEQHHLDLDVRSDGTIDWFYMDRLSSLRDSGDDTSVEDEIPNSLHSYLKAFFSTP